MSIHMLEHLIDNFLDFHSGGCEVMFFNLISGAKKVSTGNLAS